jgi:hypothetical protein
MRHIDAYSRSVPEGLAHLIVAGAVGLVGLPLVFGSITRGGAIWAWLWLGMGVLVGIWLLLPSRVLAAGVARLLGQVPVRSPEPGHGEHVAADIGRLTLSAVYVIVLQATLRRPMVAALGAGVEPFLVEASIAVVAFVALMIVFGWALRVARPLLESLAWTALDSLLATSGSEATDAVDRAHQAGRGTAEPTRLVATRVSTEATRTTQTRPAGVHGGQR